MNSLPIIDQPQWQEVMWQPKVAGHTYDVPVRVLSNTPTPDALALPGYGENTQAVKAAVRVLGSYGIGTAAFAMGFSELPANRTNIERTAREMPVSVMRQMNQQAGKPEDHPYDVIGNSQGGGTALVAYDEVPELFDRLGLIAPLGLNGQFLGNTDTSKRHQILYRLAVVNNLKRDRNLLVDRTNITALREGIGQLTSDIWGRRLTVKLDTAVNQDLALNVADVASEIPVKILVGENDPVFRAYELTHSLGEVGCGHLLEKIPGRSHINLATSGGTQALSKIASWLNSNPPVLPPR